MENYRGIDYLRRKLQQKRSRVLLRYKYYEMKERDVDKGITIPRHLREQYRATLGWCGKAADSLADRLVFREFGNDIFDFNGIYAMNNPDVIYDSAILSAIISACSFIYISKGEDGFPKLQVIDGGNATGIMDDRTMMLHEGYAVLQRDDHGNPTIEAYFNTEKTEYRIKGEKDIRIENNPAPYALLVPIVNRPDARRPFGHSRISRSCMYFQKLAKRTLERSEVSAEFYSFPQKYILGLDPEAEMPDKWDATIASILQFDKDSQGDSPTVGQFSQSSMSPFTEQLRTAAAAFAGETGLTLDDLGFASDNPASSEAIKASHETLRLTARKAQRPFGTGFVNAGYLAACVRDDKPYKRSQLCLVKPRWMPIFEPDFSALSGAGDGLIKIQQSFPDYIDDEKLQDLLGL